MPVTFTLHYDELSHDLADDSDDIGTIPATGPMRFTPVFAAGARVPASEYSPRPTAFVIRHFTGFLDTDGRLKNQQGGTDGVRLWGNDPLFNVDRLQYRVDARLADTDGNPLPWQPVFFDAPETDTVVYLAQQMPAPDQQFGRGPAGWDVEDLSINGSNEFVFHRTDGVLLGPVSADASILMAPVTPLAVAFGIALS